MVRIFILRLSQTQLSTGSPLTWHGRLSSLLPVSFGSCWAFVWRADIPQEAVPWLTQTSWMSCTYTALLWLEHRHSDACGLSTSTPSGVTSNQAVDSMMSWGRSHRWVSYFWLSIASSSWISRAIIVPQQHHWYSSPPHSGPSTLFILQFIIPATVFHCGLWSAVLCFEVIVIIFTEGIPFCWEKNQALWNCLQQEVKYPLISHTHSYFYSPEVANIDILCILPGFLLWRFIYVCMCVCVCACGTFKIRCPAAFLFQS